MKVWMGDRQRQYAHSSLFVVRLWQEDMGAAGVVVRGQVHHVLSGRIRFFQGWEALVPHLVDEMAEWEHLHKGGDAMDIEPES